jgi:hypothetical protein
MRNVNGKVIGVAQCINKQPANQIFSKVCKKFLIFKDDELNLLSFANMCAATVEKGIIFRKLQGSLAMAEAETGTLKHMMEASPNLMFSLDLNGKVLASNHIDRTIPLNSQEARIKLFDTCVGLHNDLLIRDVKSAYTKKEAIHVENYPLCLGDSKNEEYVNYSIYQSFSNRTGKNSRDSTRPSTSEVSDQGEITPIVDGLLVVIEPVSPSRQLISGLSRNMTYHQARTMMTNPGYLDGIKHDASVIYGTLLNCMFNISLISHDSRSARRDPRPRKSNVDFELLLPHRSQSSFRSWRNGEIIYWELVHLDVWDSIDHRGRR